MHKGAPLINIGRLSGAIHEVINRPPHLESLVAFYGYSGYGKSYAAVYANAEFNACYVEIGASWGIGALLDNILLELGSPPVKGVLSKKANAVIEALVRKGSPLILDEFDHCIKPRYLEIVRELHDKARVPIVLIGEELLPKKLEETERFHNRIVKWVRAEAVTLEDATKLNSLYCPNIKIEKELLQKLVDISQGRVRRVCTNIEIIKKEAELKRWKKVTLELWQKEGKPLEHGKAPAPRRIY